MCREGGEEGDKAERIVKVIQRVYKGRIALFDEMVEFVLGSIFLESACLEFVSADESLLDFFEMGSALAKGVQDAFALREWMGRLL